MIDKSLFICYSTPNYSEMTNVFLNSLHDIKANNINHMIDDKAPVAIDESCPWSGLSVSRSDLWYYCIRSKINHDIKVLKDYHNLKNIKYFIFTDCDVIYIKKNVHEWYNLENYIQNTNKDIYFMREGGSDEVNSGFYVIKNNNNIQNIMNFLVEVLQTIDATEKPATPLMGADPSVTRFLWIEDQYIINNLKNKINYDFIPNDYVVHGDRIFNINKSLFHHAVGCSDKMIQINKIKSAFAITIPIPTPNPTPSLKTEIPMWPPVSRKRL